MKLLSFALPYGGGANEIGASSSEALQDLVGRLTAKLQEETIVKVNTMRAEKEALERRHAEAMAAARQGISQWQIHA